MNYITLNGTFKKWVYTISIPDEAFGIEHGSFDYWDETTEGDEEYTAGSLTFEDGELFTYDGINTLPDFIIKEIAKHRKINL
tara:strand:+ start:730 stop:975 length:246 start_codon:yes stop_codon:yes gene_type:complete